MKIINFFIVSIVFVFFTSCKNNDSTYSSKENLNELNEENFYDFIQEFELFEYYENGNIKEYNYISPITGDTLMRIYYKPEFD
jgi:hypothetical protein